MSWPPPKRSRRLNLPTQQAVLLFDRAKAKLAALGHAIELSNAPEMPAAMATFHIKSI